MEETATPNTTETTGSPSRLKQAGTGGLHGLLVLLKYIIYGWLARIVLALWFVAAFIPGFIASEATSALVGLIVGLATFVGIGLAYGLYKTSEYA